MSNIVKNDNKPEKKFKIYNHDGKLL